MDNYFCFTDKKILLGEKTYIMGILNVTPDSFSDGGKHNTLKAALELAKEMESSGADFIDIGGQSTRPNYTRISQEEEWERLKDILPAVIKEVNIPVSVDTFYPFVAERALDSGAHIINDVSGNVLKEMADTVKKYNAGWILMHNKEENGTDIAAAVNNCLNSMLETAVSLGVKRENICLDAGIGFGKTMEQNRLLILNSNAVKVKGNAYLLGASRKRVIGIPLNDNGDFENRDFGTVAAHTIGAMGGADILRVHNFKGSVQAAKVCDYILRGKINDK